MSYELTSCSTALAPALDQAKLMLNDAVRADGLSWIFSSLTSEAPQIKRVTETIIMVNKG